MICQERKIFDQTEYQRAKKQKTKNKTECPSQLENKWENTTKCMETISGKLGCEREMISSCNCDDFTRM